MHRYDPARQKLALGLAFLAGAADATGFLASGGYFASFMSGNTTRLGLDLVPDPAVARVPLAIIGSFVAGVVIGALIANRWPAYRKRGLLAVVTLMLAIGAILSQAGSSLGFIAATAMAMGLANNIFSRDGEVTVGVTYMTGALVRFGQGVAARLSGRPNHAMRGYGLLWTALAMGAAAGAWAHGAAPTLAPSLLCAMSLALLAVASFIERDGGVEAAKSEP
ncbi:DUF1275 domain-containing protein [Qipengyuania sp. 6B39]|uniref:YoaK family protein n=1 Tax=Qipengyuania proteolytica TaxID=2867239 RepID=UPI001C89AE18|nr:DUF1275 domain-containing protein [Qipengyuania proteolytica]